MDTAWFCQEHPGSGRGNDDDDDFDDDDDDSSVTIRRGSDVQRAITQAKKATSISCLCDLGHGLTVEIVL
jgi:hypothetical protein